MRHKSPGESVILISTLITLVAGIFIAYTTQKTTHDIVITGKIKKEQKLLITDLRKLTMHTIGDVVINNHLGETKGTARGMSGVLFRDVLQLVELDTDNPKLFSEYYFICKAKDGYKVVYSWNEIFNTSTGDSAFIVLVKDSKSMEGSEDNLLMVSARDVRTGRRYVKNLETIYVGRTE
jgi:hypothetical protein